MITVEASDELNAEFISKLKITSWVDWGDSLSEVVSINDTEIHLQYHDHVLKLSDLLPIEKKTVCNGQTAWFTQKGAIKLLGYL